MTTLSIYQETPDSNLEDYFTPLDLFYSQIVEILSDGAVHRFNEMKHRLKKLSSNTLSSVLKRLVSEGVVNRLVIPVNPPRTQYSLTQKGMELSRINADYIEWLKRWKKPPSE